MICHELQTNVSKPPTVSQTNPTIVNANGDDSTGNGSTIRTLVELHATPAKQ